MAEAAAIISLLKRERYYRDTRQWAKLRACYHPDASRTRICVSAFSGNADGFVDMSQRSTPPGMRILHTIDPVDISIKGDKAVSHSNATISTRTTVQGVDCDVTSVVRGISRLQRDDEGEWVMLSLEVIFNRDSLVPASPQSTPFQLDGLDNFRPSYAHLAWFMSSRGITVPDDLPGEDRPASADEIIKRTRQWLEEA